MLDAGFLFLVGIAIPVSSTQHLNFDTGIAIPTRNKNPSI